MPISGFAGQATGPVFNGPEFFPFRGLAQRFLPLGRIRELYRRSQQPANRSLLENVLAEMRVDCRLAQTDLERIPATGPVVVAANHPFGLLDGTVLGALLSRVRPDVKILTNYLLSDIPELHEHCIFVDPFDNPESAAMNRQALRRCVFWLHTGGMLGIFPAGEVSHLDFREFGVVDPKWNPTVARLVRLTGADALPVYFRGHNSAHFQAIGLLHPSLRTAWLLNEFLGQEGKKVEVRVGTRISGESRRLRSNDREMTDYLRWRTYLLAHREPATPAVRLPLRPVFLQRNQVVIAKAGNHATLLAEITALAPERQLAENREFVTYLALPHETPSVMDELGRLRELTFRMAGEGTGKCRDLDKFDLYYRHLLLWSKSNRELVGAYRLGATADILPRLGAAGLYTNTLFRYDGRFLERVGPALELGRSFVRPEYQRQFAPLLMLWKGIGRFLARHPETPVLFGAVSISRRYNRVSRQLIVRFFEVRERNHQLAALIKARRPPRLWIRAGNTPARVQELDDLSGPIGDLETDGKGIPILIKQYARLGGRLLSFNVDRSFSDVLDGFVLIDLRQTDPGTLARYMGKSESEAFRRYHGLTASAGEA